MIVKLVKSAFTLLVVLSLVLSLGVTAFAAEPTVTFLGLEDGFAISGGSEYTATDLFDSFKNVLPGDRLTETVTVENAAEDCDYIKLYLRALPHDGEGNPLTYSETFENADGKDQAGIDGQRDESIETMLDFLSKLTLRLYNGETLIYEASPDQTTTLAENVYLGTLYSGESLQLRVELDVPAELGNEYASRVGEVDWIFMAEGFTDELLTVHKVWADNNDPNRPERISVQLLRDGEVYDEVELSEENQWTYTWDKLVETYEWTVVETEVPEGYEVSYETKDGAVWITNSNDYQPPVEPEPVELTVKKVWAGDEKKLDQRPTSVSVTLYNGETAVSTVSLSAANNWTHTWTELDGSGDWSVLETGIPKDYTPSYAEKDGVVTITNTASLIDTGLMNWPIPVLSGLGVLLLAFGAYMMLKKRKQDHA